MFGGTKKKPTTKDFSFVLIYFSLTRVRNDKRKGKTLHDALIRNAQGGKECQTIRNKKNYEAFMSRFH